MGNRYDDFDRDPARDTAWREYTKSARQQNAERAAFDAGWRAASCYQKEGKEYEEDGIQNAAWCNYFLGAYAFDVYEDRQFYAEDTAFRAGWRAAMEEEKKKEREAAAA